MDDPSHPAQRPVPHGQADTDPEATRHAAFQEAVTHALEREDYPAKARREEIYARALALLERDWKSRSALALPEAWAVERRALEAVIAEIENRAAEITLLRALSGGPPLVARPVRDIAEPVQEAEIVEKRSRAGWVVLAALVLGLGAAGLYWGLPLLQRSAAPPARTVPPPPFPTETARTDREASDPAAAARWLAMVQRPCSDDRRLATLDIVICNNAARRANDERPSARWFTRDLLVDLQAYGLPGTPQAFPPPAARLSQAPTALSPRAADLQAQMLRGRGLLRTNDAAAAEQVFSAIIQADPQSAEAYLNRSSARIRLNNDPGAIADLDSALQLQPDNAPALRARALLQTRQGNRANAIADLSRAITIARADPGALSEPDLFDALRRRAALYDMDRNDAAELADLDALVAMIDSNAALDESDGQAENPADREARNRAIASAILLQRGALQGRLNANDKALADLSRVVEMKGDRATAALIERSRIYETTGRTDQAIEDLKTALALDPSNSEARAALDRLSNR